MHRFIRPGSLTSWTGWLYPKRIASTLLVSGLVFAGCSEPTSLDPPVQDVATEFQRSSSRSVPNATLGWQEQARTLVAAGSLSPLAAARAYALVSLAQYGAVDRRGDRGRDDLSKDAAARNSRLRNSFDRGAIAGSSWVVLSFLFPSSQTALDERVRAEQTADGTPAFLRGFEQGKTMGNRMVAWARADRFTVPWTGTIPVGPGKWTGTAPPAGGTFGNVAPYLLTSGDQFRPAPPPEFNSRRFLRGLEEVRRFSDNRTPEQLAIAQFWNFPNGTPTPPGYWNQVAGDLLARYGATEPEATHVFGLMNAAVMDAFIGCWEAKYYYWYIRPSQADPAITLPIGLPNHPSYPSGHSCASAAATTVLSHFFPKESKQLRRQLEEAGLSRMYGGIHYRFDIDAGQALGQSVARYAMRVSERRGLLARIP